MSNQIKWGVLGSGGIARRRTIPEGIVPAANARLVSVFDLNASRNAEVAQQFGATAAGSVGELLKTDLDAVYIATPPKVHREQVIACAEAGKHVLCEKPLGLSVADAEAMIAACRKGGVKLGTAFMMRFLAQHQAALQLIRESRLGQPVFARAQLSCWYPPLPGAWRQDPALGGGGSLMDMGGHCIDLLEMFFGPVRAVSCFTRRSVHDYASEDSAVASLSFANGALGVVDAFFCMPDEASQNRLELYGSMGSILAKGTIGQGDRGEMIAFLKESASGYHAQQARSSDSGLAINPTPVNTYRAEIEEFSQAILEGREPSNNGQIGLQAKRCSPRATSQRARAKPSKFVPPLHEPRSSGRQFAPYIPHASQVGSRRLVRGSWCSGGAGFVATAFGVRRLVAAVAGRRERETRRHRPRMPVPGTAPASWAHSIRFAQNQAWQ